MNRAVSLFEVKSVNDELREIRGLATSPSTDRAGDVVLPEGARFQLPVVLLWQHRADEPLGHVVSATVTKAGIEVVARIAKDVNAEIDRAWSLIKGGLVRGLSIGFRALSSEPIAGGGR